MKNQIYIILLLFILSSCSNVQEQKDDNVDLEFIKVEARIVPKDSIKAPITFKLVGPTETKVIIPKITLTNTNVIPTTTPDSIKLGILQKNIFGINGIEFPKQKSIRGRFIKGRPPMKKLAKSPSNKGKNPMGFLNYGVAEGLNTLEFPGVYTDSQGNIWARSNLGGVTKFDGEYFYYFTELEGLCSNSISSIIEDWPGHYWFASGKNGITEYDGRDFYHYSAKEGLINGVGFLFKDESGDIWIGGADTLIKKEKGRSGFTFYTKREGLEKSIFQCCYQDRSKNLWFGTYDKGVVKFDGQSFTNISKTDGLITNDIHRIIDDKNGDILFCGWRSITRFNGKYLYQNKEFRDHSIWDVTKDKQGDLWFATWGNGVYKFDGKNYYNFSKNEGITDIVFSVSEDANGNMWFGTYDDGIYKLNSALFSRFTEENGLTTKFAQSIFEDNKGNIGFADLNGISFYDGSKFTNYRLDQGVLDQPWEIIQDKNGEYWIGGYNQENSINSGLVKFDGKSFLNYSKIKNNEIGNVDFLMISDDGSLRFHANGKTYFARNDSVKKHEYYPEFIEDNSGYKWGGYNNGVSKFDGVNRMQFPIKSNRNSEPLVNMWYTISTMDEFGNIYVGSNNGVYRFDGAQFIHFTEKEGLSNNIIYGSLKDKSNNIWFATADGLSCLTRKTIKALQENKYGEMENTYFKTFKTEDGYSFGLCRNNSIFEDSKGNIWLGTNTGLVKFNPNIIDSIAPNIQLTNVLLFNEEIDWFSFSSTSKILLDNGIELSDIRFDELAPVYYFPQNLSLQYNNNSITFKYLGITTNNTKKIKYKYKLKGYDKEYSSYSDRKEVTYGNLDPGSYCFNVMAINEDGFSSENLQYVFTVRPPWWQTWWFRTIAGLIIFGTVLFYIKWRERSLKLRQKFLEKTVTERTVELKQKNHLIEEKQKEIIDSINYAKRIQYTLLAHADFLKENIPNNFVYFNPKDIVSGDFYWAAKKGDKFYLAVCDSTGHGVPGAFMSLLNIGFLSEAINEKGIDKPNEVFNFVRQRLIDNISKEGQKDGFDGILICMDQKTKQITYSAANNKPILIQDGQIIELEADRMPVGMGERKEDFKLHLIDLKPGDSLYLYTDGYADQFGGPRGKKFKYKALNELILANSTKSLEEQHKVLKSSFEDWRGDLEQVDDVCLIGIKI